MKSTPGSDHASPLQGQVKFVPSIKIAFSFAPEPNAEMLFVVTLPGDVAEIPSAALMKSNMPNRRTGIVFRSSGPNRVSNPLLCFNARSRPVDHDQLLDAGDRQHDRPLEVAPTPTAISRS